jgi:hypothetical protein
MPRVALEKVFELDTLHVTPSYDTKQFLEYLRKFGTPERLRVGKSVIDWFDTYDYLTYFFSILAFDHNLSCVGTFAGLKMYFDETLGQNEMRIVAGDVDVAAIFLEAPDA